MRLEWIWMAAMGALAGGGTMTETKPTENGIAYVAQGDGARTVVLVHGANADRSHWYRQLAEVPDGERRVAVDLAGHGANRRVAAPATLDGLARCVAEALDELEVERAVLVGHSNGASVVRRFATLWPERTEALLFADGALRPPIPPELAAWMRSMLERPDYAEAMRGRVEQTPRGGLSDEDFELVKRVSLATPRETARAWLDAMTDEDAWTEDAIEVPLLVLRTGARGGGTDADDAVLERIAPHATVERWEDCGHFLMLERPADFERALAALLAKTR